MFCTAARVRPEVSVAPLLLAAVRIATVRDRTRHGRSGGRCRDRPTISSSPTCSRSSFLAVGRKYGVSDNAVRKWLRYYERKE